MRRTILVSIMVLGLLTIGITSSHATQQMAELYNMDCAQCHTSPPVVNNPPVADAGSVQKPAVGATVSLNGNGSSDPDGDPLTFQWSLTSSPDYSEAVISNPTRANATFVADVSGEYVVELVVYDGTVYSNPDILTISTENSPPTAVINLDQQAFNGNTVNLDGSGSSDPDGDPLIFKWSLGSVPDGSAATLSDPAIVAPTFVADVTGEYVVDLTVNDGIQDSPLESTSLNVTLADEPPAVDPPVPGDEVTQEDDGVTQEDDEVTQEDDEVTQEDDEITQEDDEITQEDDEVTQEDDGDSLEDDDDETNQSSGLRLGKENNRGRHKGDDNGVRSGRR